MRSSKKRIKLLALFAVFALATDQIIQHTLLADGFLGGQSVAPFDPPVFTRSQEAKLAELIERFEADPEQFARRSQFDAELGWCARPGERIGAFEYDALGSRKTARPLTAERPGSRRLLAMLGCSFTRGDEVAADVAWPALLDEEQADLRVGNFGIGGFGIDQALLRYRRDVRPLAPDEVWLGFLPRAGLRVTSHFTLLLNHWSPMLMFKPRFVLGAGDEPLLAPNPAGSSAEAWQLLRDQASFMSAIGDTDYWIRRVPQAYAPRGSSWTHRFALTRFALTWLDARERSSEELIADSDGEVHRLLRALILQFASEVQADGAEFRLLVLPDMRDLTWVAETGEAYWGTLVESVAAEGIPVLDCSAPLLAARAHEDTSLWAPKGHYARGAHRLVLEAIEAAWFP